METHKCKYCNKHKTFENFNINKRSRKLINKCKECTSLYLQEYRQKNKENLKIYKKNHYKTNKELICSKSKLYREKNIEKIKERDRNYYNKNKEVIKEKQKEYQKKNKEAILLYKKEWGKKENVKNKKKVYYEENKHILNKKSYIRKKERLKTDTLFKFKESVRNLVYGSFYRNGYTKKSKAYKIIGCTFEELKDYLESKFEPWMSWDNYGLYNGELNYGWDIDHITPIDSALAEEDIIRLNHYENLQPLCSKTNRYIKKNIFKF